MTDSFSPNKLYTLQSTGSNDGTWGIEANAVFSTIDLNLGGRLNKNVAGNVDITISASEAQNGYHVITGALTGNIQYKLPNTGGFYTLKNSTSGSFTLTAIAVGGTGIVIPQGSVVSVFVNPDTTSLSATTTITSSSTTGIFVGGTTSGTNTQTVTVSTSGYTYATGNTLVCTIGNAPTGAWTLNANSLGAVNVYKIVNGGTIAAGANDATLGQVAIFVYDGAQFQLINPAPPIEITFGLSSTPPSGKLLLNGNTLGSASSGATRAGSVFATLYAHIWNSCSSPSANVIAPVSGGLGVSAAADFAANKPLTMPTGANYSVMGIGSTITQSGATAGALTAVSTGSVSGTSGTTGGHTLTTAEMPSHTHDVYVSGDQGTTGSHQLISNSLTINDTLDATATSSIQAVGGGGSHTHPGGTISASYTGNATSILHPVLGLYVYISY